jgi:class 3 adenylate cyclase
MKLPARPGTETTTTSSASVVASVVFLKIQEFARRPVTEQARLRAQLEAVVAVTTAELEAASRIVLEASDGTAVVVLGDPKGALRLAERALTAVTAGLPLSSGVNHGAVQLAGNRRRDGGMVGDGIAVAASVAEFASPSRLLISRSFRDALADVAPGVEAGLAPAGTFTDPGLRTHELYSPDRHAGRRRARRYLALGAAAVVVLLGAAVVFRVSVDGQQKFVDGMAAKYRSIMAQGEAVVNGLFDRVPWQRKN